MRVIIAGSRGITDYALVCKAVSKSRFVIMEVVSGGAAGVDTLGERWARERSIPVKRFIPDWKSIGRGAGFVRNGKMAKYADALVAVWDGKSRGTKNMIEQMNKRGKPYYVKTMGE